MELTLKIAKYLIYCQGVLDLERGLEAEDYQIRDQIETSFPAIKQERLEREFDDWLSKKIDLHPCIIEIKKELENRHDWSNHQAILSKLYIAKAKMRETFLLDKDVLWKEWEIERIKNKLGK